MTDQSPNVQLQRHTDDVLTQLVEMVETARVLPMSSSCVLPRERVLDLLDELRELLPPEVADARKLVATRDEVLHTAHADAAEVRTKVTSEADAILADATHRGGEIVHEAQVQAHQIVEKGKAEHAELVSSSGIHRSAVVEAEQLQAQARELVERTRSEAAAYDARVRGEADAYAAKLTEDSARYADETLSEMAQTLLRSANIAERGRVALAKRHNPVQGAISQPAMPQTDSQPAAPVEGEEVTTEAGSAGLNTRISA